MNGIRVFGALLVLSVAAFAQATPAPAGCPLLSSLTKIQDASNLFNEERENDLGDAIAEHTARQYRFINDPAVNAYLKQVGERLLRPLPPSQIRFQFLVIDVGEINAYSLPGGRVFLTRKLIAAARSEDELASFMAHEIGHIVTRHSAIEISKWFRSALKISALKDRADVFERYHQLIERSALTPSLFHEDEAAIDREQKAADDAALYLTAMAGYKPAAYAEFWDRINETRGRTGGFLSDFFGTTRPGAKRLRQMRKTAASLPEACIGSAVEGDHGFQRFQASVAAHTPAHRQNPLTGVVFQKVLDPPLQADLTNIRFSPDAKYLLAQDDSSIFVASRDPLQVLFRIDAPEAEFAQFAPDSDRVVFHNRNLRVESWSIAQRQRAWTRDVVIHKGCVQSALSPDGKFLSCLTGDGTLLLQDIEGDSEVFRKENFFVPGPLQLLEFLFARIMAEDDFRYINMEFSPDGKTLAAAKEQSLAYDLKERRLIKLGGKLPSALRTEFVFVTPDRIVALNAGNLAKSWLLRFPSGEVIKELKLPLTRLGRAARGDYVLMRPVDKYGVGVLDINTNKGVVANRLPAFDIHETIFASQTRNGELAIFPGPAEKAIASVRLPLSPFSRIRAAAISPDFKYLAVSERNRGALWQLAENRRITHVRGFRGAHITSDKTFHADFPKFEETERSIAKFDLDSGRHLHDFKLEGRYTEQNGPYLLSLTPKKEFTPEANSKLEVKDIQTNQVLWSRDFPKEVPERQVHPELGTLVLRWSLSDSAAKQELKADPALAARMSAMGDKEGDYLVAVLDARSGKTLGRVLIETGKGSFRIEKMMAAYDTLVVTDSTGRVLIYSIKDGRLKARTFGDNPSVSPDGKLIAVGNEEGSISVLETTSLRKRYELHFGREIALSRFSADGKQLFVLTRDQTAYLLDLGKQVDLLRQK